MFERDCYLSPIYHALAADSRVTGIPTSLQPKATRPVGEPSPGESTIMKFLRQEGGRDLYL